MGAREGGSYIIDPNTGELTPNIPPAEPAPEPAADAPPSDGAASQEPDTAIPANPPRRTRAGKE